MQIYSLYVLCKGIFLKHKNINFIVKTPTGNVYYNIKHIKALECNDLINTLINLKQNIPQVREKLDKFENLLKTEYREKFEKQNPLVLLSINNIILPKELKFDPNKELPKVLENRANEFILSLGIIHSAPIRPVAYILVDENKGSFALHSEVEGITFELYQELLEKRDVELYINKYLTKLYQFQKNNERIKAILGIYRIALEWKDVNERIIWYWMILEILGGGVGLKVVQSFIKKYRKNMEKELKKWSEMRSSLIHSGKFKEGYDYNKESKNMREFIEELILKVIDSKE